MLWIGMAYRVVGTVPNAISSHASTHWYCWLHIVEAVAAQTVKRETRCLGLIGTCWLIGEQYLSGQVHRPRCISVHSRTQRNQSHHLDELVCGIFKLDAIACFHTPACMAALRQIVQGAIRQHKKR